ncbi:MAG: 6-bladed beta-propeller [Mongoliitalea sp.]
MNLFKFKLNQLLFLSSFILPFFIACTTHQDRNLANAEIVIDVDTSVKLNYSDIFESLEIIPLESTHELLVGDIDQVLFAENRIFIVDENKTKSLFIFDGSGKLVKRIESKGLGPGELFKPTSAQVLDKENQLVIFDGRQGKCMFYDYDGNFLHEIRYKDWLATYDWIYHRGHFYFYSENGEDFEDRLFKTTVGMQTVSRINTFFKGDSKIINGTKNAYLYPTYEGFSFLFNERNSNRILEIQDDVIKRQYVFSFSKDEFKPDLQRVYQAIDFTREFWRQDQYALGDGLIDGEKITLLSINKGRESKLALWKMEEHAVKIVEAIQNDMDRLTPDIILVCMTIFVAPTHMFGQHFQKSWKNLKKNSDRDKTFTPISLSNTKLVLTITPSCLYIHSRGSVK